VAALFTGDDPTTLESGFGGSTLTAAQERRALIEYLKTL